MRTRLIVVASVAAVLVVAAVAVGALRDPLAGIDPSAPALESGSSNAFAVKRIATGFNRPTWVGTAPGDHKALWVLEQPGRVVRLRGDRRETVIDIQDQVRTSSEQGLLGIAFSPDFRRDGVVYLHWSNRDGDTRVGEFRDGELRPRAPRRRPGRTEPQRRPARLRARRAAVSRPRRRRWRVRPRALRPEPEDLRGKLISTDVEATDADVADRCSSACATRGASPSTPRSARSGSATSARTRSRRSNRVLLEPDEPPKNLGWSAFEGTERAGERHDARWRRRARVARVASTRTTTAAR